MLTGNLKGVPIAIILLSTFYAAGLSNNRAKANTTSGVELEVSTHGESVRETAFVSGGRTSTFSRHIPIYWRQPVPIYLGPHSFISWNKMLHGRWRKWRQYLWLQTQSYTLHQPWSVTLRQQSSDTLHQPRYGTWREQRYDTLHQPRYGTWREHRYDTLHQPRHVALGQQSFDALHKPRHGRFGQQSFDILHQSRHGTWREQRSDTLHQPRHGTFGQQRSDALHQSRHSTLGQQSFDTLPQPRHVTLGQQIFDTLHQSRHCTLGQQSFDTLPQPRHGTLGQQLSNQGREQTFDILNRRKSNSWGQHKFILSHQQESPSRRDKVQAMLHEFDSVSRHERSTALRHVFAGVSVEYSIDYSCRYHISSPNLIDMFLGCTGDTVYVGGRCLDPGVPHCVCDDECMLFRDCCVDAIANNLPASTLTPQTVYRNTHPWTFQTKYLPLYQQYSDCVTLRVYGMIKHIQMINSCPPNSTDYLTLMCETTPSIIASIPVSLRYTTKWQIVFRNVFCAFCHGINEQQVMVWRYTVRCPDYLNMNQYDIMNDPTCVHYFRPPNNPHSRLRPCVSDSMINSCRQTSNSTVNGNMHLSKYLSPCDSYIAPVTDTQSSLIFRNIHCIYCTFNVFRRDTKQIKIEDFGAKLHLPIPVDTPGLPASVLPFLPQVHSLTTYIGFDVQFGLYYYVGGNKTFIKQTEYDCANGSRYNYKLGHCQRSACIVSHNHVGVECIHLHDNTMMHISDKILLPESPRFDSKQLDLDVVVQLSPGFISADFIERTMRALVMEAKFQTESYGFGGWSRRSIVRQKIMNETIRTMTLTISLKHRNVSEFVHRIDDFYTLISGKDFKYFTIKNITVYNSEPAYRYFCKGNARTVTLTDMEIHVDRHKVFAIDIDQGIVIDLDIARFELFRRIDNTNDSVEGIRVQNVTVCLYSECTPASSYSDEYVIQNHTEVRNETVQKMYEVQNGTIYVCRNNSYKFVVEINDDTIFEQTPVTVIIRLTTSVLSILGFILTIIIYVKTSSVQNIHGRCLVSLSGTMTFAVITAMLVSKLDGTLCIISAIANHFFWVSGFAWMSIISYDMMRIFVVLRLVRRHIISDKSRFNVYGFIAWGIPFVLVAVCVVLNFTSEDQQWSPGYGVDGTCSITSKYPALAFLILPAWLCLMFNIVAFILTVIGISRSRRANPVMNIRNDKMYSVVYLKLSVIMGMTWVFAILSSVTRWYVFLVMHELFNGLQGVFVFISFALRAHLCAKLRKNKSRRKIPTRNYSDINSISAAHTF